MLIAVGVERCGPERRSELLALARDEMELLRRLGAQGSRLLEGLIAGEGSDVFVRTSEFDGAER
jgi:hypothetical protein